MRKEEAFEVGRTNPCGKGCSFMQEKQDGFWFKESRKFWRNKPKGNAKKTLNEEKGCGGGKTRQRGMAKI